MGGMLTQPDTNKRSDEGEGLGLRYGLSSMQGWRPEMEDAHDVKIGLRYGLDDWSFFAVFDGHAGKNAAAFAAWNLLEYILRDSEFDLETGSDPQHDELGCMNNETYTDKDASEKPNDNSNGAPQKTSNKDVVKSEKTSSDNQTLSHPEPETNTEETQQQLPNASDIIQKINEIKPKFASFPVHKQVQMVRSAIKSGFLRIDQTMRASTQDMSGCTAVCTLISPTHLFIANCGDSRVVLYDGFPRDYEKYPGCVVSNHGIKFASEDHKPFNPKERKRIIDAGGTATQRINGTLAVSRALGDFEFKKDALRGPCEQLVSPEPEVTVIERNPKDKFLILACDGIWDVISNIDLCIYVRWKLWTEPSLEKICSSVLDVCLRKGSRDNMSVIIVVFEDGYKLDEEAIARAKQVDEQLLEQVDLYLRGNEEFEDFSSFMSSFHVFINEVFPELKTPGAGIEGSYDLIRDRYEEYIKLIRPNVEQHTE